jgi:hypothetical protein
MYSTIQATFDKSKDRYVRAVMKQLKLDEVTNVKRIAMGQLFDEMTACIVIPQDKLRTTLQILIANNIKIYSFDSEYKKVIDDVMKQPKGKCYYPKGWIDTELSNKAESYGNVLFEPKVSDKVKKEINDRLAAAVKNIDHKSRSSQAIDNLVKEGNYRAIKNWIQNNPLQNQDASEKYTEAIRNYININKQKGIDNKSYIDTAILKLSEIVCDKDIKAITTDDFINIACNAILSLCSDINPESLINVINLPNVSQRLNVLAAIKLSELIFNNEVKDEKLLMLGAKKINRRYLLQSYDVMEAVISEINKSNFNRLIDAIIAL